MWNQPHVGVHDEGQVWFLLGSPFQISFVLAGANPASGPAGLGKLAVSEKPLFSQ